MKNQVNSTVTVLDDIDFAKYHKGYTTQGDNNANTKIQKRFAEIGVNFTEDLRSCYISYDKKFIKKASVVNKDTGEIIKEKILGIGSRLIPTIKAALLREIDFQLPKEEERGVIPEVVRSNLMQPKPMQGLCADNFAIASSFLHENYFSVEITLPTPMVNLIKRDYLSANSAFKDAVATATGVSELGFRQKEGENLPYLHLTYDDDLTGLKQLFSQNVMVNLAEAINPFYEEAQKKAQEYLAKQAKLFGLT